MNPAPSLQRTTVAITVALGSIAFTPAHAQHAPGDGGRSASLAWNRVALEAIERARPTQHVTVRLLAHLSLAQHAALSQAVGPDATRAAVISASARVIAGMLPGQADLAQTRARETGAPASMLGEQIAERILAEAATDGFTSPWAGRVPEVAYAWRSLANPPAPPAYPVIGSMRPLLLDSGKDLRPAPPPAIGSERYLRDLAEVRAYSATPTEDTRRIARFYDMTTGTMAGGFWNEQAQALIEGARLAEREAIVVLSTMNAAMMDALVACHEAKYAYWVPRPSQADPAIRPLIGVPNHPSYPSNHSCLSTAAAQVLAHFFPAQAGRVTQEAQEAGLSRIYAGIHYRFDVEAGEEIGRGVARAAIARHPQMLARFTPARLSAF